MQIGDAFLLEDRDIDPHLWVVISHPQENAQAVVIVNLTSLGPTKDQSCVLNVGDHPWISHATCVHYADAKCVSEETIDQLVAKSLLQPREPAADALLAKILRGAAITDAMPIKCRRVLVDQDLIDDA
ncbi:MAG: hypothetical protein K2Y37_25840 [Pirellulales bacterium]|nr:hypothetical protein [Pirellulales bacterium]